MQIWRVVQYEASCDKCGETVDEAFVTKKKFVLTLRRLGWLVKGDDVLCPACKPEQTIRDAGVEVEG